MQVLQKLEPQHDPRLLAGTAGYEDAGVFQLDEGRAIVQTVDFFPPIVDDPRWFGRIAAANALSDVFAMGGECLTALNLVGWPEALSVELLGEVMAGGQDKVIEAGAVLCGGHSVQMPSVLYGMSVTGEVDPKRFWRNSGAQEGDRLILTKPLGIGIVSTAMKKGRSNSELDAAALTQMATLNQDAAKAMAGIEVHAATDVTGFGIMGHGGEMAEGAGLSLEIDSAALPLFPGSLELARSGLLSGGSKRGQLGMEGKFAAEGVDEVLLGLMFDAETSGGLLLAVAEQDADHAVERLRDAGALSHAIVGGFCSRGEVQIRVS